MALNENGGLWVVVCSVWNEGVKDGWGGLTPQISCGLLTTFAVLSCRPRPQL